MASKYPGLEAARRGASPETEYLLSIIDALYAELVDKRREVDRLLEDLAEAREEVRIALAQRQDYRAYWTQARALLELATNMTVHASSLEAQRKIRAFLASLDTGTPPAG